MLAKWTGLAQSIRKQRVEVKWYASRQTWSIATERRAATEPRRSILVCGCVWQLEKRSEYDDLSAIVSGDAGALLLKKLRDKKSFALHGNTTISVTYLEKRQSDLF